MSNFDEFETGETRGLAEQVYHAFKPTDLAHVKFVLGVEGDGGFTPQIAYDLASQYPDLAKRIVARA